MRFFLTLLLLLSFTTNAGIFSGNASGVVASVFIRGYEE